MKIVNSQNAPVAIGPYSQAVIANGMIYVSGQIPIDVKTSVIATEIKSATAQSLENIKAILEEAGSSMSKVVKVTIYLDSMSDFQSVNEVYAKYFSAPYPARACFEVAKLPKDALVEIECVAIA